MDYLRLLLRIIHIGAGIFWVGGTLITTFFIGPTVGATAEAGQKFIGYFMNNLKFSQRMSAAAGSTVLAGLLLYGMDAQGGAWARSGAGIGFGLGAIAAIVGMVYGILIGRTLKSLVQLSSQIQGKPSAEQATQLQNLQKQQRTYSNITVIALIIAVLFMATARYFIF